MYLVRALSKRKGALLFKKVTLAPKGPWFSLIYPSFFSINESSALSTGAASGGASGAAYLASDIYKAVIREMLCYLLLSYLAISGFKAVGPCF